MFHRLATIETVTTENQCLFKQGKYSIIVELVWTPCEAACLSLQLLETLWLNLPMRSNPMLPASLP